MVQLSGCWCSQRRFRAECKEESESIGEIEGVDGKEEESVAPRDKNVDAESNCLLSPIFYYSMELRNGNKVGILNKKFTNIFFINFIYGCIGTALI